MLVSWNVRGLNKMVKTKEVSSRLRSLNPMICILLETRVKHDKADKIRCKLKLKGRFLDNYTEHENGRIWIWWNNAKIKIRKVTSSGQLIHYGVYDMNEVFQFWLTAVYGADKLDQRKRLWSDIKHIHQNQQGMWFLIGDFNNVVQTIDRRGGSMV
ncbi:unnamed protein product [Lathyrus sativus]|nr:unnamed protein product [Lathyrus sativus]